MDVFNALEERVERLVKGYRQLQERVAQLEEERRAFQDGSSTVETLKERVASLEAERDEVRARLEKLLETIQSVPGIAL
jgi:uncharacterized coiled-coil protein SlyX